MLTPEGCQARRDLLWQRIPSQFEWMLIGDPRHVQYLSSFRISPQSFSADQRSLLLLERGGSATLLADNFARRAASGEPFVTREIITTWYTHRKSVQNRDDALLEALQECRGVWSAGTGLVESHGVTNAAFSVVAEHAQTRFSDVLSGQATTLGDTVRSRRRQKHADEIELLKRCMTACDAGHEAAFGAVKPGVTELDVYLQVASAAQQSAGCACVVYGDFRATNAAMTKAGGLPTNYVLREGDLFILDYSVIVDGYRSDFTNTIAVGTPSEAQQSQFETCRDALLAAESKLKAGEQCRDVYAAATQVVEDRGYAPLNHHIGHGLGLEHPEPPILVSESDDVLMENDVVTLEPGLYIEGVGGMRFEHNYRITESGCERLSNHVLGLAR